MRFLKFAAVAAIATFVSGSADAAATLLWGNSAGSDAIDAFDPTTGAHVHAFNGNAGNGRGIVVVGNTIYYTVVGDGVIHEMDATTGAVLGASINTGQSSLSTISFDGTNFWLADYSGTNQAYEISPTGSLLSTIHLADATGNTDGLEYFNGHLIANRSDGCCTNPTHYDIYDLNGAVITADFIVSPTESTGIAFDGTNFYTSNVFGNSYSVWDSNGVFINTITEQSGSFLIEDLSVDFAARSDTCGGEGQPPCETNNGVPEPLTLSLFGAGLAGAIAIRRRRKTPVA